MNDELPEGWAEARLAEVADVALGKMLDRVKRTKGRLLPYLRNANVRWGEFDLTSLLEMHFQDDELDRYGLERNDLLICEGGEPGRAAVWKGSEKPIKYQKALLRVRTCEGVDPRWVMRSLQHDAMRGALESYFTGSTIKHFPQQAARAYRLPVPPLQEQRRIVAKLEELLGKVDACKERLAKIPALFKRFRQSVLAAACTGRLTEDWREVNPASDCVSNDDGLPAGWRVVSVGEVVDSLRYGTARKCSSEKRGSPVLRIPNVVGGTVNHSGLKYTELPSAEAKQLRLEVGDILLIRSNGSVSLVGRCAIVREPERGFAYAGYLIRIRPCAHVVAPEFLALSLGSYGVRCQIELQARSTSGVNNINSDEVRALRISLPPLPEQREIVRRANGLVASADQVEWRIAKAQSEVDQLCPSLLAKGFRGELVPTEAELARREGRSFEPAGDILEKIREGREQRAEPLGRERRSRRQGARLTAAAVPRPRRAKG